MVDDQCHSSKEERFVKAKLMSFPAFLFEYQSHLEDRCITQTAGGTGTKILNIMLFSRAKNVVPTAIKTAWMA